MNDKPTIDAALARADALGLEVALASSRCGRRVSWQVWIDAPGEMDDHLAETEDRDPVRAIFLALKIAQRRLKPPARAQSQQGTSLDRPKAV